MLWVCLCVRVHARVRVGIQLRMALANGTQARRIQDRPRRLQQLII
jgi:hypothetical protein